MNTTRPRVAIVGAGPVGLEAALAAADAGYPFTLFEAADAIAGNVRRWRHVRLFTPWSMNVSPRLRAALAAAGHELPDDGETPTGGELVDRVFEPVSRLVALAGALRRGVRVREIGRDGLTKEQEIGSAARAARPFRLLVAGRDGRESIERADIVIDASGTIGNPNSLGDGGIAAPGERAFSGNIERYLPDFSLEGESWSGRTILLAGAGHSAQTAARELARLAERNPATRVVWILRRRAPRFALPEDPLPERAGLAAAADAILAGASPAFDLRRGTVVESLAAAGHDRVVVTLRSDEGESKVTVDRILSLTGGVGDASIYRQLQVHECYAYAAPMKLSAALLGDAAGDCLDQAAHGVEALANPEPNFFIAGAKSYGRFSTFLLRAGWQQIDDIFAHLGARSAA